MKFGGHCPKKYVLLLVWIKGQIRNFLKGFLDIMRWTFVAMLVAGLLGWPCRSVGWSRLKYLSTIRWIALKI